MIVVSPCSIWDYFQSHKETLTEKLYLVASDNDCGTVVYLTNTYGFPEIQVFSGDVRVDRESIISEDECEETVAQIYSRFLCDEEDEEFNPYDDFDEEDAMFVRESELQDAMVDFLASILSEEEIGDIEEDFGEICEDVLEHILEYMARKHNVRIYRPMYLEYEDGTEEISPYPYQDMEFEDEDNPIYKK